MTQRFLVGEPMSGQGDWRAGDLEGSNSGFAARKTLQTPSEHSARARDRLGLDPEVYLPQLVPTSGLECSPRPFWALRSIVA